MKKAGVSENTFDITILDIAELIYFPPMSGIMLWINFAFNIMKLFMIKGKVSLLELYF